MMEMSLSHMSDLMVMAGFKNFSREARMSDVKSLMYLGEVAARKLYVEAGYSSMLTDENHVEVLRRACRLSEEKLEYLVAEFKPKPRVNDSIRRRPNTPFALGGGAREFLEIQIFCAAHNQYRAAKTFPNFQFRPETNF